MTRRVVITGVGLTSPIGNDLASVSAALREGRHGIRAMPEWSGIQALATRVGAPVDDLDLSSFPRKKIRTMGRVSLLSTYATDQAVEDAGLDPEALASGRTGLCHGSTQGSTADLETFARTLFESSSLEGIPGSLYLKFMSHTCAANLAQYYGITGRVIPTVAACASASQAIGLGFETIRHGLQDVMVCGGAEEMHVMHAAAFDLVFAASSGFNDRPEATPRPYDRDRDGLVIGEGAGTLVLEEYDRARARKAPIYAEVLGFGLSCDGTHITAPSKEGMATALRLALADARIGPSDLDYINAHGTATEAGDIAESLATQDVVGSGVAFSSTKSYTGHTLGACGAIEVIFCLAMMRDAFVAANRNLNEVDERCGRLDYVRGTARELRPRLIMTNNFAFGGINTSLVLKRV
jgi:3-oxoacyl-[acyl-carrier-protein] synthase II